MLQEICFQMAGFVGMPVKGPEWLCIAGSVMLLSASPAAQKMAAKMGDIRAAYVCSGSQNMLLQSTSV